MNIKMSNSGTPYIGSKINLVSKAKIRYEGFLYTIDTKESTVTLAKVVSLGTENRKPDNPIPPRDEVFEYIVFRGSDIEDLHVNECPKPGGNNPISNTPNDPAIVHTGQSQHRGQVQPPINHHFPGSYAPFGGLGGLPLYNTMYQRPEGHVHATPSGNLILGRQPSPPSIPKSPSPSHSHHKKAPGSDRGHQQRDEKQRRKDDRDERDHNRGSRDGGSRDNRGSRGNVTSSSSRQDDNRRCDDRDHPPRHRHEDHRRDDHRREERQDRHREERRHSQERREQREQKPAYDNRDNRERRERRGSGSRNRKGSMNQNQQRHKSNQPSATQQYTEDFDFESWNAKFNKQDVEQELITVLSKAKISDETEADITKDEEKESDTLEELPSPEKFYDRSKSFFDNISCEAKPSDEHPVGVSSTLSRRQERNLNCDTFGTAALYRPRHNGWRGRGRGRGRGGRGRGRGRGYYNNNSNREWVDYKLDYDVAGLRKKSLEQQAESAN